MIYIFHFPETEKSPAIKEYVGCKTSTDYKNLVMRYNLEKVERFE